MFFRIVLRCLECLHFKNWTDRINIVCKSTAVNFKWSFCNFKSIVAELLRRMWRRDASHQKPRPGSSEVVWAFGSCSSLWVRSTAPQTCFSLKIFENKIVGLLILSFLSWRLQDISSGYWVLVLHFTRREAVRQIDDLQHIATNLGRSKEKP